MAGAQELIELLRQRLANAGDLTQPALRPDLVDVLAQVEDVLRGAPVGQALVDHLALDLQHVGDEVEDAGHLAIVEMVLDRSVSRRCPHPLARFRCLAHGRIILTSRQCSNASARNWIKFPGEPNKTWLII